MLLNEICQLDVAYIRVVEGIRCFVVSDASLVGSIDKTLKTGASERLVPIHQTLIDCDLMHYVEQQRRAKRLTLFDDIDPGPRGKRAVPFSTWFPPFSRAIRAYQARPHSEALREGKQ